MSSHEAAKPPMPRAMSTVAALRIVGNGTVVRATAAAAVLGSGSSGGSASAAVDVVVSF